MALVALSILRIPPEETLVWEAESYAELRAPFALVQRAPQASGDAYLELPLGAGQGWRGQGQGSVRYRVEVTREGDYTLWARALWQDGCTNAFFVGANGGERLVLGNDAVYGQWHWVKLAPVSLQKGVNLLELSNHSDGTALDKLIATNAPRYKPQGLGEDITRFYDGFAGCDADNTGSWEFLAGTWKVLHHADDAMGTANDCLAQWDESQGLALAGYEFWEDYRMAASLSLRSEGTAGIVFFSNEDGGDLRLALTAAEGTSRVQLVATQAGTPHVLAEAPVHLALSDAWCTLAVHVEAGELVCRLDDAVVLRTPYGGPRRGRIGIYSQDCLGALFDNVDVTFGRGKEEDPNVRGQESCPLDRTAAADGGKG
jgi:hypothetical protein